MSLVNKMIDTVNDLIEHEKYTQAVKRYLRVDWLFDSNLWFLIWDREAGSSNRAVAESTRLLSQILQVLSRVLR